MRLYSVLVLGLLLVASGTVLAAPLGPTDLTVDVKMDATPQSVALDTQISREVVFTLNSRTKEPITGEIHITLPNEANVSGKRVKVLKFDLTKVKSTSVKAPITLPASFTTGKIKIPVQIVANSNKYLDMDVYLSKSIAWYYVGSFAGGVEKGHDKVFPPETSCDISSEYTDKDGKKVGWKLFPSNAINEDGMFEFHTIYGMLRETTAYAMTTIYSPKQTKARLLLGSDDSIKVWQNGKLVHNHKITRGSGRAQDSADIVLDRGTNVFLIKVCQFHSGWGFHFDMDDGNGKPVPEIKWDVIVDRSFITDPELRLTEVNRNSATITWQSDVPTTSKIMIRRAQTERGTPVYGGTPKSKMVKPLDKQVITSTDGALTTNHSFAISNLEPGTRYLVSVSPALDGKESEPLAFYTAAPEGKTMYLKLKIIHVIFTNVTPKSYAKLPGANQPVSQDMVDRIKDECEKNTMFYWINSGMRLLLENEYIISDKFYVVDDDSYYGVGYSEGEPDEKALVQLLAAHGKKPTDYDGRVFISCEKHYDKVADKWWYPASGGGTIGPESKPGNFKCAWKAGSPNAWMYCHEGGHGIDSLYHHSMGPEFIFNHPQPWDGTAHRTGDHYDANAYILWDWAGYVNDDHQGRPFLEPTKWFRYFISRWGVVQFADDFDGDGIPDNDPRVPLDEVRWGSDPTKKDTDGDGLDDLQEAMACEWVDTGLGEIWAGPISKHRCDPRNPDTDGDGIPDGQDPYPLYPAQPEIVKNTPTLDGVISDGEYAPFVEFEDKMISGEFFLAWDDDYLYIAGRCPVIPREVKFTLDMDDDGWYMGHDNYHLVVKPEGDARPRAEWHNTPDNCLTYAFHNCGVPGKWPFYDKDGLKDGEIKFAQSKENGYSYEIAIPKNQANGVVLVPGKKIGITFGVIPKEGSGHKYYENWYLTPIEPHVFYTFELVGK